MSNMVPQSHELNAGIWEDLEKYCRTLVLTKKKELYIIAGPAGQGGTSARGTFDTLDAKVVVPEVCWKVVLVLDREDGDPVARVTENTRVICVIMNNDTKGKESEWWEHRKSLKAIEDLTGFWFFDKVPEDIRKKLRTKVDTEEIE
jgi:endonuclease G